MTTKPIGMWDCWAKTDQPPGSQEAVTAIHRVVYHNLDVAAVVNHLLRHEERWWRPLSEALGVSMYDLWHDLPMLYACHDIGKLTDNFQARSAPACTLLDITPQPDGARETEARHDLVGWERRNVIREYLKSGTGRQERRHITTLLHSALSHHGYALPHQKREGATPRTAQLQWGVPGCDERLTAYLSEIIQGVFGPMRGDYSNPPDLPFASYLLAGVGMISDWLGSTPEYFPLRGARMDPRAYWETIAQPQAERACTDVEILYTPLSTTYSFWSGLLDDTWEPRPLQVGAETLLSSADGFVLIEASTGAGKTEVGLALARQMMRDGDYKGLTLALPTRATANGLYGRAHAWTEATFDEPVTMALIHSTRSEFKPWKAQRNSNGGLISASEWLLKSSRQSMFSQINVCTIDQALLATIGRYFAPMRLSALTRTVLLIDEVHAFDAHMLPLLCNLLAYCGRQGQPVIAMSATCDSKTRRALASAYRGEVVDLPDVPLPALTHVSSSGHINVVSVDAHQIRHVHWNVFEEDRRGLDPIVEELHRRANRGEAVVWFRNTVRAACAAYEALSGYDRVLLLHSRYTVGHREVRDAEVLRRFGKGADPQEREGYIVICTQVLQESLDVSFDWGVSDVCEADLLIQRSGRVLRHESGEEVHVEMGLFTPSLAGTPHAQWLSGSPHHGGTSYVYGDAGRVYASAAMCALRSWELPTHTREILDDINALIPAGLARSHQASTARDQETRASAVLGSLDFTRSYRESVSKWGKNVAIHTRDAIPTCIWEVHFVDGDRLRRIHNGGIKASGIAIPMYMAGERLDPSPEQHELLAQLPFHSTDSVLIVTVDDLSAPADAWRVNMTKLSPKGAPVSVTLIYDHILGLQVL